MLSIPPMRFGALSAAYTGRRNFRNGLGRRADKLADRSAEPDGSSDSSDSTGLLVAERCRSGWSYVPRFVSGTHPFATHTVSETNSRKDFGRAVLVERQTAFHKIYRSAFRVYSVFRSFDKNSYAHIRI